MTVSCTVWVGQREGTKKLSRAELQAPDKQNDIAGCDIVSSYKCWLSLLAKHFGAEQLESSQRRLCYNDSVHGAETVQRRPLDR